MMAPLLILAACNEDLTVPTPVQQPPSVNVTQVVNVNLGNPTGSPSPGTGGPVDEVKVVMPFGENCPAGIAPANAQRTVRVGCSAFITCTPKCIVDGAQVDCSPAVHGPKPDFFGIQDGAAYGTFSVHDDNPFN